MFGLYNTWKTSGRHTGEMCGLLWKSIRPKEYLAQHLVVDWELHCLTVGLNVLDLTVQFYHRDVIVQSWIGYVGSHHRALSSRCHCTDCRRGSQDDNWKVKTEFSFTYSAFPKKRRDGHQPDREDVHLEVGVELGVRVNIPLTEADLQKYYFDLISSLRELFCASLCGCLINVAVCI